MNIFLPSRRTCITGLAALATTTACSKVRAQTSVSPEAFGVRSGPLSRVEAIVNTEAMRRALEDGRPVDGGGRSYDLHGELRVTQVPVVRAMTLRQRSLDVSLEKFFLVDGLPGTVVMQGVTIDLLGLPQVAGMSQCSAIQISHCGGAFLEDVTVRNGAGITGIKIVATPNAVLRDVTVTGFRPRFDREPRDDVCQGVEFQLCQNFEITQSRFFDIVAGWPSRDSPSREYSRGIAVGNSSHGLIARNEIGPGIEQGIDISGGPNRRIEVLSNQVVDAGTWGIKCANWFNDISIRDNLVVRPGCAGIVCSAPGVRRHPLPGSVTISDNTVIDTGASGLWQHSEPAGIMLYARVDAGADSPTNVVARRNRIIDRQTNPTMVRGLDAVIVGPGGTGANAPWPQLRGPGENREMENVVSGFTLERSRGWL